MIVYRVEMNVAATAYIKARSVKEAKKKADDFKDCIVNLASGEHVTVSGADFNDPDLPEKSFSPVATCLGPDPNFEPDLVHKEA